MPLPRELFCSLREAPASQAGGDQFESGRACEKCRFPGVTWCDVIVMSTPRISFGHPRIHSESHPADFHERERDVVIVVEPDVEAVFGQVRRVTRHTRRLVVINFSGEDPTNVSPPPAFARRMRVSRLIGLPMVNAMRSHPGDRAAFECQSSADSHTVFDDLRHVIRAVGSQPSQTWLDEVSAASRRKTDAAISRSGLVRAMIARQ